MRGQSSFIPSLVILGASVALARPSQPLPNSTLEKRDPHITFEGCSAEQQQYVKTTLNNVNEIITTVTTKQGGISRTFLEEIHSANNHLKKIGSIIKGEYDVGLKFACQATNDRICGYGSTG